MQPTKPLPSKDSFTELMEKTLELTGQKIPPKSVRNLYQIFTSLMWEFPDYNISLYTILNDEGQFKYAKILNGKPDAHIILKAEQLHQVVYGRGNMPKMFLTGQIKLIGIPKLKLMKFVPLLGPFLDSYKEAYESTISQVS